MKNKLSLILLFCVCHTISLTICSCNKNSKKQDVGVLSDGILLIKDSIYDFGDCVKEKMPYRHEMVLFNGGSETIQIYDVKTSCGCVKATVSKKFINPNDTSRLMIEYDSNNKSGFFHQKIMIYSSSQNNYGVSSVFVSGTLIN